MDLEKCVRKACRKLSKASVVAAGLVLASSLHEGDLDDWLVITCIFEFIQLTFYCRFLFFNCSKDVNIFGFPF